MVHGSLDVTGESVSLVSRYPPRRSGASKQENWMKPACSTNGMAKFPIISALWISIYIYISLWIIQLHSIFWRYQPFFLAAKPGHPIGHPGAILALMCMDIQLSQTTCLQRKSLHADSAKSTSSKQTIPSSGCKA